MKKKVLKILFPALAVVISFILQSVFAPRIAVAGISPNILVAATVSVGILCGDYAGIFAGFAAGLLCDVFFGQYLGFYALIYMLIGYIAGKTGIAMFLEDITYPVMMCGAMDFLYGFYCFVFQFLFRNRLIGGFFLRRFLLPEVLYTLLCAVVLYPSLRFLHRRYLTDRPAGRAKEEAYRV